MLREQDGTPEGLRHLIREQLIPALERSAAQRLVLSPNVGNSKVPPAAGSVERHQFHEICFCLRGRAEMWVGSEVAICEENQTLIIPSGIQHSTASVHCVISAPEEVFSRLLWVSVFPFGSLLSLCESAYGVHRTVPRQLFLDHHGHASVEQMLTVLQEGREGSDLMIKYLLLQMLVGIWQGQAVHADGIADQDATNGEIKTEGAWRLSDKIIHYVRRHYYLAELSLEMVARAVSANKSHVSRQFKLETGLTITEYINKVRIDAAKRLLLAGLKVAMVAEFVGFTDPYYFTRVFTQLMGCSPTEYRRRGEE